MAIRAALVRAQKPISHSAGPARSRLRAPAAFVALSLVLTGLSTTGTLLGADAAYAAEQSVVFNTAAKATWTVPAGVTSVTATVSGASGGRGGWGAGAAGGLGAKLVGTFTVAPGDVLDVWGSSAGTAGGTSGAPGSGGSGASAGGAGGAGYKYAFPKPVAPEKAAGGGGGGASKVAKAGGATLLIAGGGGGGAGASAGATPCTPGVGGAAGVAGTGGSSCFAGVGGGAGGATAANSTGAGLAGAFGGEGARISSGAGGGGGGLLGGGGGTTVIGAGGAGGGGGGGSSFVDTASVTNVTRELAPAGNGSVTLSFSPSYVTTTQLAPTSLNAVIGDPITLTVTVGAAGAPITTPAGTVRLLDDNDTELGSAPLVDGAASFSGILLPIDSHTLRGVFTPDDDAYQESSGSASITVVQGSTATELDVSPAPAEFGESVTATITVSPVAPADALLDGTVELRDQDENVVGDAELVDGAAEISFVPTELAPLALTAFYLGNDNFMTSNSVPSELDVTKSESLLELSQSIDASVWGENVALTAEISAARDAAVATRMAAVGTEPTGTVTFYADGVELDTVDVVDGAAAFEVDDLEVGTHELSASYSGDTYFTASAFPIDSDGAGLQHEVELVATATALTSDISSPVIGQTVTFTATVAALAPGTGTPTGSVVFTVDGVALDAVAVIDGVATLDRAFWSNAGHNVSAAFTGDVHYAESFGGTVEFMVAQAETAMTLGSDANPAVFGQAVTVSATLGVVAPGAGVPSGEIEFELDGVPLATVPGSAGVAVLPLGDLAVGSYELSAHYAGDESYAGSDGTIEITVEHAATTVALTADSAETSFGQPLTLHAALAVTAPGAGVPTGSIAFLADGAEIGFATLNADGTAASLTVPEALAVGARQITAHYAGDMSFAADTSEALGHTVLAAPVGIVLDAPAESVAEQETAFTATVQPLTSTGHVPTGFVQFAVDGEPLGAPVPVGATAPKGAAARAVTDVVSARIATDTLPAGDHLITAQYLGDGSFAAADSGVVAHTVKPKAPIDPIKPIDPLTPIVPATPVTPTVPAAPSAASTSGLATTGVQGIDMGIAASLLLLAGLGMLGVGAVRLRRRSA